MSDRFVNFDSRAPVPSFRLLGGRAVWVDSSRDATRTARDRAPSASDLAHAARRTSVISWFSRMTSDLHRGAARTASRRAGQAYTHVGVGPQWRTSSFSTAATMRPV